MRRLLPAFLLFALGACSGSADDGVVDVAVIGQAAEPFDQGLRLSPAAQLVRSAERQGLVRLNQAGEVLPGIAERWIVTDDGRSYIFRITEFDLPDGSRLTAQTVRDSLRRTIARLEGTSLGLDLARVAEVRAMTGRVIEIRLKSPMPGFLQLLAQPELGVSIGPTSPGPMTMKRDGSTALFTAMPPEARGLPAQDDWGEGLRAVNLTALSAQAATRGFTQGQVDVIFGGRMESLPLASTGALSRGTVRLDSAVGLFGLDVVRPTGFLGAAVNREAVAMAIDRPALIQPLNIGGWAATTRLVPSGLPGDAGTVGERWSDLSQDQRRARAAAAVARWKAANGGALALTISLPEGPGSDLVFAGLARDLSAIGITARRAGQGQRADLALRDRVARYAGVEWFLNQFNCSVSPGVCAPDADFLVRQAVDTLDPAGAATLLAEAEQTLTATNLYIPLGSPIRWSQVRADVEGYSENIWAFHPLFPLSRAPI